MNNHKEKCCYKKKRSKDDATNNVTEGIIHNELFIEKVSINKYGSKTFIPDSSATSHMVTIKENMSNPRDVETRVIVGDSGTLTRTKCFDCHRYHKYDGKVHCVTLSDMSIIPGLHANLFSVA